MIFKYSLPLLVILLLISCGKDDNIEEPSNDVSFSVNSILNNSGRISVNSLDNAAFLLITIEKTDGSSTDYFLEKIELYLVDNEFISKKITLPIGDYNLTEFFVLDSENNITHIAPLEGSEQAQNVNDPLPIEFTVLTDQITSINVEVISSEDLSLEGFGLAGFNLSEIDLFNFLISVSEQSNHAHLLDGTLTIVSDEYQFNKELLAITNNSIVIKDGFSSYEVTIEKEGYEPYSYSFTRDSLGHYETVPLVIELITEGQNDLVDCRDGEVYKTIEIGNQTWMAENLRATKYTDGADIIYGPLIGGTWQNVSEGLYAWYEDNSDLGLIYGALYNWEAVASNKLCPCDWHVPTESEWLELFDYVGGQDIAGGKLKEVGFAHWSSPNTDATDEFSFTALPNGIRFFWGDFNQLYTYSYWWTSTQATSASSSAVYASFSYAYDQADLFDYSKFTGIGVRCVKD